MPVGNSRREVLQLSAGMLVGGLCGSSESASLLVGGTDGSTKYVTSKSWNGSAFASFLSAKLSSDWGN